LIENQIGTEPSESVASPYSGKQLTVWEQINISCLWLAINAHWGALLVILLPDEIRHIAPFYRPQALGLFTAIGAVVALIIPLLVGPISDRCMSKFGRRKPFIGFGILVNIVGLILMAAIIKNAPTIEGIRHLSMFQIVSLLLTDSHFLGFLGAYMVVQLGSNIASAAYMGFVPDLVPADQRGAASGYLAVMSQAGTLVGAVGAGYLLQHASDMAKYAGLSLLLAIIGGLTIFGVKENRLKSPKPKVQWGRYFASLVSDLQKHPDFFWVWITRFLVMLGFYAIQPFINYYLTDVLGFRNPSREAAKLIAIILMASSISGFLGGTVSDQIGRKRLVLWSSICMAITVILFIFCKTFGEALGVGILFGFGFGAYVSVDWALGTDVLPSDDDAGKDMAVWHIAMTLPQSISPLVAGGLIGAFALAPSLEDHHLIPHYSITGYALVFIFCAISFLFGGYFLKNVKGST